VTRGKVNIAVKGGQGFTADWTAPLLWAGNWFPDYIDKGQISRRIVTANFEKIPRHPDTTLKREIIKNELPAFVYKCLLLYNKLIVTQNNKDIYSICPGYFTEQQEELKMEKNPLYAFLIEHSEYAESESVLIDEIKNEFSCYIGKPIRALDHGTFTQVNPGYEIIKMQICKSCTTPSRKGCCEQYSSKNRTLKTIIKNLRLI
jgi:hypothetical protein